MNEHNNTASLEGKVKALAEIHIPAMTRFGRVTEHGQGDADVFAIFGPVVEGRQAYVVITVAALNREEGDLDAVLLRKVRTANDLMTNNLRHVGATA